MAARQVSLDLASFEVVRGCADALLGLLRERLLDIVFCNEQEAAALAEVLPRLLAAMHLSVLRSKLHRVPAQVRSEGPWSVQALSGCLLHIGFSHQF